MINEPHRVFDWRYASLENFLDRGLLPSHNLVIHDVYSIRQALARLLNPSLRRAYRFVPVTMNTIDHHPHSRPRRF